MFICKLCRMNKGVLIIVGILFLYFSASAQSLDDLDHNYGFKDFKLGSSFASFSNRITPTSEGIIPAHSITQTDNNTGNKNIMKFLYNCGANEMLFGIKYD